MALAVFEVLNKVRNLKTKADKISFLKENESWALKDIIRGTMDSTIKWTLPEGEPPYTPAEAHNHPANLMRENTKFTYFAKGGKGDRLPSVKRERIFLEILEGVHPEDAKLVISMINKEPIKGVTRPIVEEAFPGLLQD